jgi:metal-dependent hydrolase (beta-lactamase superfamily II)
MIFELAGKPQPDQHWHEHATCFRLGDRGLVVISSCGHGGIINTLKQAQEVSGVEKIYALLGGFHLAPAPDDYLRQVMAELKKFDLEQYCRCIAAGRTLSIWRSRKCRKSLCCARPAAASYSLPERYIAFAAAPICGHDRGPQLVVMRSP